MRSNSVGERPGQERFTRLRSDTLWDGYGEADIKAALSGSRQRPGQPRQKVSLAIDIQSKLHGKGPGYERRVKVFNLKQMAACWFVKHMLHRA